MELPLSEPRVREDLDIPFAGEFSPGQVSLLRVLQIADDCDTVEEIVEGIRVEYFSQAAERQSDPAERLRQQTKRANNARLGMKCYGLLDEADLTALGKELLSAPSDKVRDNCLATHILLSLRGLEVLDAVKDLQERGERVTKIGLVTELRRRGFDLATATTKHQTLLNWLRPAGVLKGETGYDIDHDVILALTGVTLQMVDEWSGLSLEQQAFLRSLRQMVELTEIDTFPVKQVLEQAILEHGSVFTREDQLRATVFKPLENMGWLQLTLASSGRGGKSGTVTATEKLEDANFTALTGYSGGVVPSEIRTRLAVPMAQVLSDLESDDKYVKGIALEVLAVRLAADIGLVPTKFRLRGIRTGGAEVDIVAESAHLHHSRWLFQCKNTTSVQLADLAKEVGMAVLLHAHVIVMVTTGRFASSVSHYAKQLMQDGWLQVILIDDSQLKKYRDTGYVAILTYLRGCAHEVLALKAEQLDAADSDT